MKLLLLAFSFVVSFGSYAQVGVGTTTPDPSAQLHLNSSSKGILIPKMTEAQRNAVASPATGLLIYQTNNTPGFYYYTGTSWTKVVSGANPVKIVTGYITTNTTIGSGYTLTRLPNNQYTVSWPAGTFPGPSLPDVRTYGGAVALTTWAAAGDGSGSFTTVANAGSTIWFTITEIR